MKFIQFTALAMLLGISLTACSQDKKTETKTKEEQAPTVPTVDSKGLKIAFYYSDSLKSGFTYFKNEDERLTKKGKAFENELMSRQKALESLQVRFQERYQQGTATPEEMMGLENEIKRKNQQLLSYQQSQGGALEKETSESLTALSKKIEVAGKKYCEKYGIDILLIHGQGGQINFINEKMNVTQSFIDFLNHEQELLEKDMGK